MDRKKKVFKDSIRQSGLSIVVFLVTALVCATVFYLYNLSPEPFFYAFVLAFFFCMVMFLTSFFCAVRKDRERSQLKETILNFPQLPVPSSLAEKDYEEIIEKLLQVISDMQSLQFKERDAWIDYLTNWVHEIKTPMAVIRMELSGKDTDESRKILQELFRIEEYVEAVLQYMRLDSDYNDLVIQEYALDEIIRSSIRKYASQFIQKKLTLTYEGTREMIVSDRKWLGCILDQIISNGVKYTNEGGITIAVKRCDESESLSIEISDTGPGIPPEDLPGIFEKGYTGQNGRKEGRSSGLGLYLASMAAKKLSLQLEAESVVGKGSTFRIKVGNEKFRSFVYGNL